MALKIKVPAGDIPNRIQGVLDGDVPVRFDRNESTWSVSIGSWIHRVPAYARVTTADVRMFLYNAISIYRNAERGLSC